MPSKVQGDAELFQKLQTHGTSSGAGTDQTSAELYKKIVAEGTASPTKDRVNQTIAEQYHKLSGS